MNNNIVNWAHSFSGCDGGDVNADTWLCGIEWGYSGATDGERQNYYKNELPKEIELGAVKLDRKYNFFSDESMEYPFNRGFAKLYTSYMGHSVEKYNKTIGNLLKLNISPIGFWKDKEHLWEQYNLSKVTGFKLKSEFINYLNNLNRFTELRNKHKPKLIVCIGVGRRGDFIKCFFGNDNVQLQQRQLISKSENNKNMRYFYYTKHDQTLLVVVPFFTSSNGLNSDYLLQKAGEEIAGILND
jgi:transcriptional activator of eps genes